MAACGADEGRAEAGAATMDAQGDAAAGDGAVGDGAAGDGASGARAPADQAILDAVDPFIGTAGIIANLGNASPAATAPLGMVKAGPDTSPNDLQPAFSHCSGYLHTDKYLLGFSHNRQHGTRIPDYGNVLVLPTDTMSPAKATRYGRKVVKHADTETASPGRYGVKLKSPDVDVSLTATPRCALHRYTFAPGEGKPHERTIVGPWVGLRMTVYRRFAVGRSEASSTTAEPVLIA